MQHFTNLSQDDQDKIFFKKPMVVTRNSSKDLIAASLGASLYCPATRENLPLDVVKNASKGLSSMIICLEDSVADKDVPKGEANIRAALPKIAELTDVSLPAIFIRVRTPEHLAKVAYENYANLDVLTGFVLPKFSGLSTAKEYVEIFSELNRRLEGEGRNRLYFMPVLESPELVFQETRGSFLTTTKSIIESVKDDVLAIRIGATDMSSPYGLRRSRDLTIYDVHVISSAIADIVNTFGRFADGYQVTGSVWEHFTDRERLFKPSLRSTPFEGEASKSIRTELVLKDLDGLIREIELDRVNGILGKTVIHPLHVSLVNSMSIVTHEEYSDAIDITSSNSGEKGAVASAYRNKMNEQKPHHPWAVKTLIRAQAFGVANPEVNFVDILKVGIAEHVEG